MQTSRQALNYIVSFDTFILKPVLEDNRISTRIIERNGEFSIPRKPLHIVRKSCEHYGGSLQNSTNSARITLNNRHKTPIIIASDFGRPCIFMPTISPHSEQNIWFSYHAIENIEATPLGCKIHLENQRSFTTTISASTMYRQYAFCAILEKNFLKKQQQLSRPSTFVNYDGFDDFYNL